MTTGGTGRFLRTHLTIDPEAFIAPNATLVGEVRVGRESSIWYAAVLRGDMEPILVGRRSNIQDGTIVHVDVNMPVRIGDGVSIGHRAVIHGCTVEDGCLIGMGSTILDGARIGRGSFVGAGALVTPGTVIPPGSLVLGAPAKVKRPVTEQEREQIATGAAHYVELARRYLAGGGESRLP